MSSIYAFGAYYTFRTMDRNLDKSERHAFTKYDQNDRQTISRSIPGSYHLMMSRSGSMRGVAHFRPMVVE
jgi:hypothetical protein